MAWAPVPAFESDPWTAVTPERLRSVIMSAPPRARAVLALYYLTAARRHELIAAPLRPSQRNLTAAVGPRLGDVRVTKWKNTEIMLVRMTVLKRVKRVGDKKVRDAVRMVPIVLDPQYEPLGPVVKKYYLSRVQRAQERIEWLRRRIPKSKWNDHPELDVGNYPLLARLVPSLGRHEVVRRNEPYYAAVTSEEVYRLFVILRRELGLNGSHLNPLRHLRATHLAMYYGFTPQELYAYIGWKLPGMADIYVHLSWESYIEKLLIPVGQPSPSPSSAQDSSSSSPSSSPSSPPAPQS